MCIKRNIIYETYCFLCDEAVSPQNAEEKKENELGKKRKRCWDKENETEFSKKRKDFKVKYI